MELDLNGNGMRTAIVCPSEMTNRRIVKTLRRETGGTVIRIGECAGGCLDGCDRIFMVYQYPPSGDAGEFASFCEQNRRLADKMTFIVSAPEADVRVPAETDRLRRYVERAGDVIGGAVGPVGPPAMAVTMDLLEKIQAGCARDIGLDREDARRCGIKDLRNRVLVVLYARPNFPCNMTLRKSGRYLACGLAVVLFSLSLLVLFLLFDRNFRHLLIGGICAFCAHDIISTSKCGMRYARSGWTDEDIAPYCTGGTVRNMLGWAK